MISEDTQEIKHKEIDFIDNKDRSFYNFSLIFLLNIL